MYIPGINPYIFHIGSFGVRWYGFFMAVSMAIGIWYMVKRLAPKLSEDYVYNIALVAIVCGIIGARLVFVFTNPGYYIHYPWQIPEVYLGGLSIHGALGGGILGVLWYSRRVKKPFWPVMDATVYGICWGIMLVRIGNIFNQEILGHHSAFWFGRQPAQIYEMIMGAILLYSFLRNSRKEPAPPDGFFFWNFFLWYTVMRFCTEAFRANPTYIIHYVNHTYGIGFVTLTQWFSPLLFAIAYFARRWRLQVNEHALTALAADGPGLAEVPAPTLMDSLGRGIEGEQGTDAGQEPDTGDEPGAEPEPPKPTAHGSEEPGA